MVRESSLEGRRACTVIVPLLALRLYCSFVNNARLETLTLKGAGGTGASTIAKFGIFIDFFGV